MRFTQVTALIFNLLRIVDQKDEISIGRVQAALAAGRLFDFLEEEAGDITDLSLIDPDTCREIESAARSVDHVTLPEEMGVTGNGIVWLIGVCTELLQMGYDHKSHTWDDSTMVKDQPPEGA